MVEVDDLGLMDKLAVETFYSMVLSDQVYRMMFEESLLAQRQAPTF
jgi:truncated hemoglobin YjbI